MRLIFNLYIFNIQRVIQYSTSHLTFNYSFYIQFLIHPFNYLFNNFNHLFNIQLSIQHSTIHSTLLSPHQLLLVSDTDHCLIKTWRRQLDCRLQKQKLLKMTQGSTSMQSLTFPGFLTRFFKELTRFPSRKLDEEIVEQHIVLVDQTVPLLRIPRYTPRQQFSNVFKETLDNLSSAFSNVLSALQQCHRR